MVGGGPGVSRCVGQVGAVSKGKGVSELLNATREAGVAAPMHTVTANGITRKTPKIGGNGTKIIVERYNNGIPGWD